MTNVDAGERARPPAAQPGRLLIRDVLLRDGMTLRLQAPTLADYDDIKAFYDDLSPDSRYLRFHGFGRTDILARADAGASGIDRLALIARHDGRMVAAACYVGLREPGVAEVAFAVADDDQRRGIATRMLEQLAARWRCDPVGVSSNDGCARPDGNGSERSSSVRSRPAGPTCW